MTPTSITLHTTISRRDSAGVARMVTDVIDTATGAVLGTRVSEVRA